jgi:hypothetical protein
MIEPASKYLKVLYCLNLVAMMIVALLYTSYSIYRGVIGPSSGADFDIGDIGAGLAAIYGLGYRINKVRTFPAALDVFEAGSGIHFVRGLGVMLMTTGLPAFMLLPLSRPIASLWCARYDDLSVCAAIVAGVLCVITVFGWIGLGLFEASRYSGLKAQQQQENRYK